MKFFLICLLIVNLFSFMLCGIDKLKAKMEMFRIPESVLLFSAVLGGAPGFSVGMILFHHKISKPKFRFTVPFLSVLYVVCVVLFLFRSI